jgi:hypothetical protein
MRLELIFPVVGIIRFRFYEFLHQTYFSRIFARIVCGSYQLPNSCFNDSSRSAKFGTCSDSCGACRCRCRCDRLSSPSLSSLYPFCTVASVTPRGRICSVGSSRGHHVVTQTWLQQYARRVPVCCTTLKIDSCHTKGAYLYYVNRSTTIGGNI